MQQLDGSLSPGSREKGHPGRARTGNGNSRAESRGTHRYTKLPQQKALFLQGPKCPSSSTNASGQSEYFHHPLPHSLLQQFQTFPLKPQFCPTCPDIHMCFAFPTFLQAPQAAASNLLPTTIPAPRTHPCAPHPIKAGSVSLHCIFWSSTDLQTSRLWCELVCRSARISINDNAERKVPDSVGHLGFYLFNSHCYKVGWDGNPTAFL